MASYLKSVTTRGVEPTQAEPLAGQSANHAGGYSFTLDRWQRLERFLILGSEGGTYYASEKAITKENVACVAECIAEDGLRVLGVIIAVSQAGRAPKNDPALYALAMCAAIGDTKTRRTALAALPGIARTGTHLFHFLDYVQQWRGWGRSLSNGVKRWYASQAAGDLVYQAIKYQSRDGFSHRDALRLCHIKTDDPTHQAIYHWIVKGWPDVGEEPHPDTVLRRIWAFERAKRTTDEAEIVRLIDWYDLPRECIPTEHLNNAAVWAALLRRMPIGAMVRNLGKLSNVGLLVPFSEASTMIADRLHSAEAIKKARLHPIALLSALRVYASGAGVRGKLTWTPVAQVIDALDDAFYLAFKGIEPARKRVLLALDVSGSMAGGTIAGVPGLTPRDASAAMALVTAKTEPDYMIMGFHTGFTPLAITSRMRLDTAIKRISDLPFGGTDCSVPITWALEHNVDVDAFVVYTDSETWAGVRHPARALAEYRHKTGRAAKLIVVGMTATEFTIADPNDAGMLDVVGFDTAAPSLMADFIRA